MNLPVKSGTSEKNNLRFKPSYPTFVHMAQNQFDMKMKNIWWIALVFILATMASCRRDRKETLSNTITVDNSTAENLYSDLFKVVDNVSASEDGIRDEEIGCIDTIIVDTLSSPRSVLIDFGDDQCVGDDGRTRTGQIYVLGCV